MSARSSFVIFAFLCSACASSKAAEKSESAFPTQEEFQKLLARELPDEGSDDSFERRTLRVDSWTLAGPQPQNMGVIPKKVETLVEKELVSGSFHLDEASYCIARELGLFFDEHGMFPSEALSAYLTGWCGSIAKVTVPLVYRWESDPPIDSLQTANLVKWLEPVREPGVTIGVWHSAKTQRLIIVWSRRSMDIDPIPLVQNTPVFELRGRLIGKYAETIGGFAGESTRGPFGFEHCTLDHELAAPQFRFRCSAAGNETRFSFRGRRKGSGEIYSSLAEGIRFRTAPGNVYRAPVLPKFDHLSSNSDLARSEIVDTINVVRARANLAPMRLALEQSDLISAATPHLRAARKHANYEIADDIILGLKAGWHVQEPILNATWVQKTVLHTDPNAFLEDLVTSPGYRKLIYHPDSGAIAIDVRWIGKEKNDAHIFAVAYQFVPDEHYNRTVGRAFARINEVRAQFGRKPAKRMHKFNTEMRELCEGLSAGRYDSGKAYELLQDMPKGRSGGQGWWLLQVATSSLDRMSISPDLAQRETAELALCVATYRKEAAPWVHNHVLMFWVK